MCDSLISNSPWLLPHLVQEIVEVLHAQYIDRMNSDINKESVAGSHTYSRMDAVAFTERLQYRRQYCRTLCLCPPLLFGRRISNVPP